MILKEPTKNLNIPNTNENQFSNVSKGIDEHALLFLDAKESETANFKEIKKSQTNSLDQNNFNELQATGIYLFKQLFCKHQFKKNK